MTAEPADGAARADRPVRVVLVDDQTLVRQGIRRLLEFTPDVAVVGEAADGIEALDLVRLDPPDVLLLDLRMPRLDGHGVLRKLATWADAPPVLVLTTFDDDEAVLGALRLGARGYLLKDVSLDQLVEAIRTLAAGGRLVQPAVTATLVDRLVAGGSGRPGDWGPGGPAWAAGPPAVSLTGRELDVLRLMAAGFSNREIAAGLHLAEGTVKNHVSAVLLKLDSRDRTRAVLRALELGLVTG